MAIPIRSIVLLLALALLSGCDDYTHEGVVNTPPVNYVILTDRATLGGADNDWATAMVPDGATGWYLTGVTQSRGNGMGALYVSRVDGNLGTTWESWATGWGEDRGFAVRAVTGAVVCAGTTSSFDLETGRVIDPTSGKPIDDFNFCLAKFDAGNGDLLWFKAYGDTMWAEWATGLVTLPDGFLLTGYQARGEDDRDLFLVRTDNNGTLDWQLLLPVTGLDSITTAVGTADGNVVVAGYVTDDVTAPGDPLVMKIDLTGSVLWTQRLSDPTTSTIIYGLLETANQELIIVGRSRVAPFSQPAGEALYVARLAANGTVQWARRIEGAAIREGRAAVEGSSGALFVCGQHVSDNAVMLTKMLGDGTLVWSDSTHSTGYGLAMQSNSVGFTIAGSSTYPDTSQPNDVLIFKIQEDLTNVQ